MKIDKSITVNELDRIIYYAYDYGPFTVKEYLTHSLNDSCIPTNSKKMPGSIWGITTFFNPVKYKNKSQNYKRFRENSKQQGLNLLTIELSFDGDFEIKDSDAEIVIRLVGNEKNILWQKEAMLNIALRNLPEDCDKIVWIDCDILFHNDNWVKETAKLLETYNVVQPFSSAVRLPQGKLNSLDMNDIEFGFHDNQIIHSFARGMAKFGMKTLLHKSHHIIGHTGFVWSIRRELIQDIGFFDRVITGMADLILAFAFYGIDYCLKNNEQPPHLNEMATIWRKKIFKQVQGSVYYTEGVIDHLWHGTILNRKFHERNALMMKYDFDPSSDISLSKNGLLEWSSKKEGLVTAMVDYFSARKEEG